MKIDGNAIRPGMLIEVDGRLWSVAKTQAVKPGKGGAYNQVEMKDIESGTKMNKRFNSDEKVERARLEEMTYQFLFAEGDMLNFMNQESYEQIQLAADLLGDALPFLADGMEVTIHLYEERPVTVTLPEKVTLEVTETEPTIKGQTVSSSYKPATLENGVRVMVPPFIDTGTKIIVNTLDSTYVERAKAA